MSEQIKPCGYYHPLPCGLDVECEVPVKYFEVDRSSREIWRSYEQSA